MGEEIDWDDVTIILENHFRCDAGSLFLAMAEDPLRLSFWGLRAIRVCSLGRFLILGGFIVCMLGLALGARLGAFGTLGKGDIQNPNVSVKKRLVHQRHQKQKGLQTLEETSTSLDACARCVRRTHFPYCSVACIQHAWRNETPWYAHQLDADKVLVRRHPPGQLCHVYVPGANTGSVE